MTRNVFKRCGAFSDSCPRLIEKMQGAKHNYHWKHDLQADAEAVVNNLVGKQDKQHVSATASAWPCRIPLKKVNRPSLATNSPP